MNLLLLTILYVRKKGIDALLDVSKAVSSATGNQQSKLPSVSIIPTVMVPAPSRLLDPRCQLLGGEEHSVH